MTFDAKRMKIEYIAYELYQGRVILGAPVVSSQGQQDADWYEAERIVMREEY